VTDPAKSSGKTDDGKSAEVSDTLVEVTAKLMASQASVFAVMAAWSMGMTGRMAGAMLEAMTDKGDGKPETAASPQTQVTAPILEPKPDIETMAPKLKIVSGGRPDTAPKGAETETAPKRAKTAKPKTSAEPAKNDDLKQIAGIGPRLEKVLNTMGITRFEQIARMNGKTLKDLDARLGLDNRIIRDDWAGKAKALLEG